MKESTRRRKKANQAFRQLGGQGWIANRLYRVLADGKLALDAMMLEMGKMFAEAIMDMERLEEAGADYHNTCRADWVRRLVSSYLLFQHPLPNSWGTPQ